MDEFTRNMIPNSLNSEIFFSFSLTQIRTGGEKSTVGTILGRWLEEMRPYRDLQRAMMADLGHQALPEQESQVTHSQPIPPNKGAIPYLCNTSLV